jgi:hypothetical protein
MAHYVVKIGPQYYAGIETPDTGKPVIRVSFHFAAILRGKSELDDTTQFLAGFKLPFKPEILELPQ